MIAIIHYNKWYTVINYGYATISLIFSVRYAIPTLQRFYIVFIVYFSSLFFKLTVSLQEVYRRSGSVV
ncbi:hypothetical protein [Aquimarina hainanensis]|uniref:hypothetical protein n=1 Tax=Aquimarina hainanensis TaxID=1578017 RepID=UPI00360681D2